MKFRQIVQTVLILLLAGCVPITSMPPTTPQTALRYLALGDSYTIGQSVLENERWPVQLAGVLRERGIQIADPVIIARTGWTTADLLRGMAAKGDLGNYDLVSLLIGVNDQFQGLSADGFRERFRQLITAAIQAAGNRPERVIVLSIPDWSFTPFGETFAGADVSKLIDLFNATAREECESAGVHFYDITPITRPEVYDAGLFADDGLHPSGKVYAMWVDEILLEGVRIFE
jgi:lysophospholipase L1-like esterase